MEKTAIKKFNQLCKSYFLDYWGKDASPVTVNAYQVQLQGNVLPVIGKKLLNDINGGDVYEIIEGMRKKTLSEAYIKGTYMTCARICDYGVAIDVMERNPFREKKIRFYEDEKFVPFTDDEMEEIGDALAHGKYKNLYGFIMETGFLRSEALGLYWEDIDFENGFVTLRREFIDENGNLILREYKRPRTPIKLSEGALIFLNRQRLSQGLKKRHAGTNWNGKSRYVFTDELGYPISPEALTQEICRLSKVFHLPRLSLRNLRNQYMAVNNG